MLRANCDKCHENIFEVPGIEALRPLPCKITCSGCGRRFRVVENDKGKLVFFRMGRQKIVPLKPVVF